MDLGDPEDRVFAAERIIKKRMKGRKTEFLVKWKGWSQRHNTWEPEENILDQRLIDSFERQQRKSGKKFELVQKKKKALSTLLKRPLKDTKKQEESESEEDEKPSSSSQIKIKQELDKDESSDSSDDEVLCKKEVPAAPQPEAKRKAEVLSKESGKIGITIKTSPPSATPTSVVFAKEEKLKKEQTGTTDSSSAPEKKSEDSSDAKKIKLHSPSDNNKSSLATEKASNKPSVTPIVTPTTPVVPPLAIKTTKDEPKTSTMPPQSTTKEEKDTKPPFLPQNHQQQTQTKQDSHTATAPQPLPEPQTPAKQQQQHQPTVPPPPVVTPAAPTSPYHEFAAPRLWLPKFQLTDQIFITDVTVNSETATIRECKTEKGFFKERTAINSNQESIPVTQP
ncbi:polycomb group protein Pc-like [Culicoides brevitarsis]|uniref:polycomb group protein Pc-like n=1 Tax=Culicoides brevitarsis TaxID=469753 RepID=UPI00307BC146